MGAFSAAEKQKKYIVADGFIVREIAGETTIIPADPDSDIKNGILMPNGTAAFIWKVFQHPSTTEEAVQQILKEYEVQRDTAEKAVYRFVKELLRYSILKEVE